MIQEANDTQKYGENVSWPEIPNHKVWMFPHTAVVAMEGSAAATRVPGTFSDCDNKNTYQGSALVPRADDFWAKAVQDI
jgi:hypothetical protein